MRITKFTATLLLFASHASAASEKELLIYGGEDHNEFLGCLVCSEMSTESICNGFGPYGNEYSSKGMFNEYAGFGNEYSSSSPWNEYSTSNSVPVLVDRDGGFYGYFTINDARSNAFELSSELKKYFELAKGDLEVVRKLLCQKFGYSG